MNTNNYRPSEFTLTTQIIIVNLPLHFEHLLTIQTP